MTESKPNTTPIPLVGSFVQVVSCNELDKQIMKELAIPDPDEDKDAESETEESP